MFNASRLTVARKRRQMTKKDLAEKAGITAVHLTRLERGEVTDPIDETVRSLASALRYPVEFFHLDDCDELSVDAVSFRSLSSLSARQRDAALSGGAIAFDLHRWISAKFTLPDPQLPDLRGEDPRTASGSLRSYWGIGAKPVKRIIKLLESKGVRVFALAEQHKNVDAFSCWHDGVPFVFLNTFKSAERSRFDAAHELGHLVLHAHGTVGGREAEREADSFASAFLIPRDDLISNLKRVHSLDVLVTAKRRWGVSVAALARAAFEAGLISDWHYRSLCKSMSIRGYRSKEPESMPREHSVLWPMIFQSLWKDGITREKVARILHVPAEELEVLVGELVGVSKIVPVAQFPNLRIV